MMQLRRYAPAPTISILTYHHIADQDPGYPYDPDVADATPAQFRRQLETLARYTTPIGISELVGALSGAPLPKNPILITFDDGYRSCHDTALPILKSVGIPATFFIATAFVTERRLFWWEQIALLLSESKVATAQLSYPEPVTLEVKSPKAMHRLTALIKDTLQLDLARFLAELAQALRVEWTPAIERAHADDVVMTWDQIRALARAGMDVESHTRRHRVLQTLAPDQLHDELTGSRLELEREIGRPVRALAYPVGRRITEPYIRKAIAEAGYAVGLTNASGVNRRWPGGLRPIDPFDVRRLSTDRSMSDAMYFTQVALPRLAYISVSNR
jgi:peptidoglycan/xylan/chitin deacetylase (PgdA/CDA1 family)